MTIFRSRAFNNALLFTVLLFTCGVFMSEAKAVKLSEDQCDSLWFQLAEQYGVNNFDVLLEKWNGVSEKCRGTGIYEFRLGSLYERLGRHNDFKNIVKEGLALNSSYEHYLKVSELTILLQEAAEANSIDEKLEKTLVTGYKELIRSHADWPVPYEQLSNIYLLYKKADEAIDVSKKVLALNADSWVGHRGLVIGYTFKEKYNEARPHIMPAAAGNEKLFSDVEFMCASAWVYASLDEHETANAVLNRLVEENPRATSTDRMRKTYHYAKKRYEDFQMTTNTGKK